MATEPNLRNPCARAVIEADGQMRLVFDELDRNGFANNTPAAEGTRAARFADGMFEYYVNSMLWSPKTQVLNIVSNTVPIGMRVFETAAAAGFSKLSRNSADQVYFREAIAEAQGIGEGAVEAFRLLHQFIKNPSTALEQTLINRALPEQLVAQSKIDMARRAIHGDNVDNIILKTALNILGKGVRVPGSFLTRGDIFFKVINYRAEVSKQAMRKALSEGTTGSVAVNQRYQQIKAEALNGAQPGIVEKGIADADFRTYTNRPEGKLSQWMSGKGNEMGLIRWIVPFRRTIVNLMNYGIESTPLAMIPGLSPKTIAALKAGGAAQAEALGRISVGTLAIAGLTQLAGENIIGSGPRNHQVKDMWEKNGNKEYTLKIGGEFIPLDSFGPIAPFLRAYGDYAKTMSNISTVADDNADRSMMDLAGTFLLETAEQLTELHWSMNIAEFLSAISQVKNDENNDLTPLISYANKFSGAFVPNIIPQINRRFVDTYKHDIGDMASEPFAMLKSRMFGLSDTVARKVSLWGDYMQYDNWLDPEMADPITGKDEVFVEMQRIGVKVPISRRTKMGVKFTPDEYEQFMVLSGKGVMGAPPLRDAIIQEMTSDMYKSFVHDSGRAEYIKYIIQSYRDRAAEFMVHENPDIRARAEKVQLDKQERMRRR